MLSSRCSFFAISSCISNPDPHTLYPGHYVFQEIRGPANPQVFRVTDSQGKTVTLTSLAIKTRVSSEASTVAPPVARDTEVVLQEIGGKCYLHKIWIQGRSRGWEFSIPDNVTAQVSEMNEEVLPGTYSEHDAGSAQDTSSNMNSGANAQNEHNYSAMNSGAEIGQVSSVTGCLERGASANDFYIRSASGERITVRPDENLRSEMANQTHHLVRLVSKGPDSTPIKAQWKTTPASWNGASGTNGKQAAADFQADRIDVISTSCQQ